MIGKAAPRFDEDALRRQAGNRVFPRGQEYHRQGRVRLLDVTDERVLAQVRGEETYRTELTGRGTSVKGRCNCPAFDDWGFCKHMVAVGLAANEAGPAPEGIDTIARIEAHLRGLGIDRLVAMVMDIVEQDDRLFRRLELAAAVVPGESEAKAEARLRAALDAASRISGPYDDDEGADWTDEVHTVLGAIEGLLAAGHAGLVLRLSGHAADRISAALEQVDDSDGCGDEVLVRARELHQAAALAAKVDPVALARDLFRRETGYDNDAFAGAAFLYEAALGAAGRAEYRRLAEEAWHELPMVQPRAGTSLPMTTAAYVLRNILDAFAEQENDVEARIALRARHLSHPQGYCDLAQFCLSVGRPAEALRWAEEGLWVTEDAGPYAPLLDFVAGRLIEAGRSEEAAAYLLRAFDAAPNEELYARLCALGGEAARERAVAALHRRLGAAQPVAGTVGADFLLRILMREGRIEEAWTALRRHGASPGVEEALAMASEATQPDVALAAYAGRIEALVRNGYGDSYERAVALLRRMASLRSAEAQDGHVEDLRRRYARRRNFMKLLG